MRHRGGGALPLLHLLLLTPLRDDPGHHRLVEVGHIHVLPDLEIDTPLDLDLFLDPYHHPVHVPNRNQDRDLHRRSHHVIE